jgi:isopenicillin N synthase-like dioxygenase
MFTVPTVDLAPYVDPGPDHDRHGAADARRRTAAALDEACRTVGFVQVVGHGVPDAVAAGLASALDDVFALPMPQKKALVVEDGTNRGYSPPRSESVSRSLGVEQATRMNDFFEAFNVGTSADGPATGGDGNRWPDVEGFRDRVEAWFVEAQRVARTLTTAFADALGLAPDTFTRLAHHPVEVLRMNNYAPDRIPRRSARPEDEKHLPEGADLTGMGEHTDYGIVTVLWADRVAGLQVLGPDDGVWHDVLPGDGALLVNLGDLTARLTGDRWLSTLHRVKPPIEKGPDGGLRVRRRRSAAFFHDGDLDAVVETLPLEGARPYPPTTVREHLDAKLAGSRGGTLNTAADREAARVHAAAGGAR